MKEDLVIVSNLIAKIRSGKVGRDEAIRVLYYNDKLRTSIRSVVKKMGGDTDMADDAMNTSIMIFVKTVITKSDFKLDKSIVNYITGIAKYTYLNQIKKETKTSPAPIDDLIVKDESDEPAQLLLKKEKRSVLADLLSTLGKNCKEVLMLWAHGYQMKAIADQMEYKSDLMAKKKKYQCFKQLMKIINDNPNLKESLR